MQTLVQDPYYEMSYHLSCTEDDAEVRKAVDEAQGVYDVHGKREWVEWVGKTLMPRMHAQIAMGEGGCGEGPAMMQAG
jgi:hypothetical protein